MAALLASPVPGSELHDILRRFSVSSSSVAVPTPTPYEESAAEAINYIIY